MDEPVLIGPSIDEVLNRVLPDHISQERGRLLKEHAEAVLGLRNHFRDVCRRRVLEIGLELAERGYEPSTAAGMAMLRFASERQVIEQELEEQLDALKDRLRQDVARLCQGWERNGTVRHDTTAEAS